MQSLNEGEKPEDTQQIPESKEEVDLGSLNGYLVASSCSLLDLNKDQFYLKLLERANQDIISTFAQDRGTRALLISKTVVDKGVEDGEEETKQSTQASLNNDQVEHVIKITTNVQYTGENAHTLAFLKRDPYQVLNLRASEAEDPLCRQIQVLNLGFIGEDFTIFELASTYVEHSILPLFNTYQQQKNAQSQTKTQQMQITQQIVQHLSQLKLQLAQCQQNIIVPEIELQHDNDILEKYELCKSQGREMTTDDFEELIKDANFKKRLERLVTFWVREIRRVTQLEHDPMQGSAIQEINFWLAIERSLAQVQQQQKSSLVSITLELLRATGNVPLTFRFLNDTELDSKLKTAQNYNTLLRDFAINSLLSATDLDQIKRAMEHIFGQFRQLRQQADSYPNTRAILLLSTVIKDMNDQILKVLLQYQIMLLEYSQFDGVIRQLDALFNMLTEKIREFRNIVGQAGRRLDARSQSVMEENIMKNPLQERIQRISDFRSQHHRTVEIISKTMIQEQNMGQSLDKTALASINDAYKLFNEFNVLDIGETGNELWENNFKNYRTQIDRVVAKIVAIFKNKLSNSNDANEMFRTFKIFNPLFFFERIKTAVREYQIQLVDKVEQDVRSLRDKLLTNNNDQERQSITMLTRTKGFPKISNRILWYTQIERKLNVYLARVADVLGAHWRDAPQNRHLKQLAENFLQRIQAMKREELQAWIDIIKDIESSREKEKKLFKIDERIDRYHYFLDFNEFLIYLPQELNQLRIMGEKFLLSITLRATDVHQLYPIYCSLQESMKTFEYTQSRVTPQFSKLVAKVRHQAQERMIHGRQLSWKSENPVQKYSKELRKIVTEFEDAVNNVIEEIAKIDQLLEELKSVDMDQDELAERIEKIQKIIDEFDIQNYSNLHIWVEELDKRISEILIDRLEKRLKLWVKEFTNTVEDSDTQFTLVEGMTLRIKMQNQNFILDPPLAHARAHLYTQLHKQVEIVCSVKKVEAQRFGRKGTSSKTYLSLVKQMKDYDIKTAYLELEKVLRASTDYFQIWKQYQSLWDLQSEQIYEMLGDDVEKWTTLLNNIRQGRRTFDTSDDRKKFGAIEINYGAVKQDVYNKYDQWHKEILNKFGSKLKQQVTEFFKEIKAARKKLEDINVDASEDVTMLVTDIKEIQRKVEPWEQQLDRLKKGQKLLNAQRYQFPQDWIYIDMVEFEWAQSFKQILSVKTKLMDDQIPALQAKILEEERACSAKIKQIEMEWDQKRPRTAEFQPKQALDALNIIGRQIEKTNEDWQRVCKAQELLDLELGDPDRLQNLVEDHQLLKNVWQEIGQLWQTIDQINNTPFSGYVFKTVKDELDRILEAMNNFPNKLRSHQVYDEYKANLLKYRTVNQTFSDLKSEAMKPRHWKILLKKLKMKQQNRENLLLLDLWNADLIRYKNQVNEVLAEARGEMILEDFLRKIKDHWGERKLEFSNYKSTQGQNTVVKCKLIKGWDDLLVENEEHTNNISSMKMSPYFKVFEDEIVPWTAKIENMRLIFDSWIDVQRNYVYLEGIFFGSADIKNTLPTEFNRFRGVDNEFVNLMKKVAAKPLVLEVLSIPNLEQNLIRFSDMLQKIQKGLADYLEKQRQSFARFYFVGDEDLLEIIGNSKSVATVQRHFPKMFAGITSSIYSEDGDQIQAMVSREGEEVKFLEPTILSKDPIIYQWLTKLETNMQVSLAILLEQALQKMDNIDYKDQPEEFTKWIEEYPAQIVILSMQVSWSSRVEDTIKKGSAALKFVEVRIQGILEMLAERVLNDLSKDIRQKYEQLITDMVHQRDVTRRLISDDIKSVSEFAWLYHMRFYFNTKVKTAVEKLQIKVANGQFFYGFEYLGVGEKLVQTALTDRCYLTLTQALHWRLGGSPFGPAGTGKTESVKALGSQLGKYVLVFNCDETFDSKAMSRIFIGLCQVGAWGCFDEFNRLEERMLSAVSQQILTIQNGLINQKKQIDFLDKNIKLNDGMGIFITMNPDYAGRSNLPDNLKQLFRQIAMVQPDKVLIAQVKLFSQGFNTAEQLSGKIVSLFDLCKNQLTQQSHYDFGLRALKSVLVSSGNLKRIEKAKLENPAEEIDEAWEQNILIESLCATLVPKLIAQDIPLLENLLSGVFPGTSLIQNREERIREELGNLKDKHNIKLSESFIEKVLQLYSIQNLHHGVMMVGPTGVGKTKAWKVLIEAMERVDGVKGQAFLIDPKAISKDELYGKLDSTTNEWTDGVFTKTLREVIDNRKGEAKMRRWIILDGDVDPEWVENLNSVLDDNRLLTLPSGERLQIPGNVRIMFEVENLKQATQATVSRCGMVWFSEDTISLDMIYHHYLMRLKQENFDAMGKDPTEKIQEKGEEGEEQQTQMVFKKDDSEAQKVREQCVEVIMSMFNDDDEPSFMTQAVEKASKMTHVMDFTPIRVLEATFALIRRGITHVILYNENHPDFPLEREQVLSYMTKWVVHSTCWGVSGSMNLSMRTEFSEELRAFSGIEMPPTGDQAVIDYEVQIEDQQWHLWSESVPKMTIDSSKVTDAYVVINTIDTARHQNVLSSWLAEHRPFLLCGPPGSGKTMTLQATLKVLPDMEMIFINFSSTTQPDLIMSALDQHCEYKKTNKGTIMRPKLLDKWLVIFCDEINLPEEDKYGTQVVIAFLRQLTEQNGFWRSSDKTWITLERIQIVGACNPPTDSGRQRLSDRFLRHAPIIFVDFPGPESLKQIYGTFNTAMLSKRPALKNHADALTEAEVEFYTLSQQHFTSEIQPHYIYSPRELTRWKIGIYEALESVDELEDLVRLFVHEALRLFEDRLVLPEEKEWCNETLDDVAKKWFPSMDDERALKRPILFSDYTKQNYVSVTVEELRTCIEGRLKDFYEEELNVQLVVFDSVIDHILRIDRVLKQPTGHCLLIGQSGVGKTTLTRFVSWMNNLNVFQIKAGRNYSVEDFDQDLRDVMKRAGTGQGQENKITFIFDESNVLSPAFLERMNALLASGEVPGLFDGEDYTNLIGACRECARREGIMIDGEEELYKMFVQNVSRNLHVVFTMNPANPDFANRTASSPALFNRCVIDWFGEWSEDDLRQVAQSFTQIIDIPDSSFTKYVGFENGQIPESFDGKPPIDPKNEALADTILNIHNSVRTLNTKLQKKAKKFNFITPRDFLDFIRHFLALKASKQAGLVEQKSHLEIGLGKLKESEDTVIEMQAKLTVFQKQLAEQEKAASIKLQSMMKEKNESEKKKQESQVAAVKLVKKQSEIAERKDVVDNDLGKAEPALIAAKESVDNIDVAAIKEVQRYPNPPAPVNLTLQPVFCLLTRQCKKPAWAELKKFIGDKEFIPSVKVFKPEDIVDNVKNFVMKEFISNADFDTDKIMRASKMAGPLALWVKSIVAYADIYLKIEPLRNELAALEAEQSQLTDEKSFLDNEVQRLEELVDRLNKEYEELIEQKQSIKTEMQRTEKTVDRSKQLITNLSKERDRWQITSESFENQMNCLLGDVIHTSAILTYIGFFDHYYRQVLREEWMEKIDNQSILMRGKNDLKFTEFMSTPSEQLEWFKQSLPNDELCIENAIIMKNFNRFPLIIDPSDQAVKFIMTKPKIQKTSFTDSGFMKVLENSLRFGLPILVQDVEKIDPVLNSVLNKEIQKQGGRILIRVGDKEIDFIDTFTLYMVTRDSNANFTPDLCSRVTFVNFTVTPSSLQNLSMNIFLKEERPEIEKKRDNIQKLQGEFRVKLRGLEDKLLDELNASEGNLLENDKLIATLETLQGEAKKIQKEMDDADQTMLEIEEVTKDYLEIAKMTSKIFFSLDSLSSVHFLYQYSLQQFMDVLFGVIQKSEVLKQVPKTNYAERRATLIKEFFNSSYEYASKGLMQQHQVLFALRLVQIRKADDPDFDFAFDMLMKSTTIMNSTLNENLLDKRLTNNQRASIEEINKYPQFKGLLPSLQHEPDPWLAFLDHPKAENVVPQPWLEENPDLSKEAQIVLKLNIIKIMRPDRLIDASQEIIKMVIDEERMIQQLDLAHSVENEVKPKSPVLLVSAPGYDASPLIDQLAMNGGKKMTSVAIGSPEAFKEAEQAIMSAARTGNWVLLKNVHLAPAWLVEVEKMIYKLEIQKPTFRLFLTMEVNPKVPSTLIRSSYVLQFEPPSGIKASMLRSYSQAITKEKSDTKPIQRSKLHFIVAWFNAVVKERLRYTPIGWSKVYEFNQADQKCMLECIDEWLDSLGTGRETIDPDKIPWDALRTLAADSIFGGKVDNEYDLKILQSLVDYFFKKETFNMDYPLFDSMESVKEEDQLVIPDVKGYKEFQAWVRNMPSVESPAWAGLPLNVEKLNRIRQADSLIKNIKQIQNADEEEDAAAGDDDKAAWLTALQRRIAEYMDFLPIKLDKMKRVGDLVKNPLFRFLEREVSELSSMLKNIRADLEMVAELCIGERKSTVQLKNIALALHSDVIPDVWKKKEYIVMPTWGASAYLQDFTERVKQAETLSQSGDFGRSGVWIGGLISPGAFLIATQQSTAQIKEMSLEELTLRFTLNPTQELIDEMVSQERGFIIKGMSVESAEFDYQDKRIKMSQKLSSELPTMILHWEEKAKLPEETNVVALPVYLNSTRKHLLCSCMVDSFGTPEHVWYQRGVAMFGSAQK